MSPQYAKANKTTTTTQNHRMARGPGKGHENVLVLVLLLSRGICGDNVVPLTSAMTTSKAG